MKKQEGITLIALVITIIVLLILSGVTIATLTGDNGLLSKAGQAKNATDDAEVAEQIKLAYTEWQTAKMTGTMENINDFLKNRLNSYIGNIEDVSAKDSALIVTINKDDKEETYCYNLKNGKVEKLSADYLALKEGDLVYYQDASNNDIECTVLYDSTGNYGVQIIPRNPVVKIELGNGTRPGNSSYSTNPEHFEIAKASYNDAINILNTAAQTYVMSNSNLLIIAESSRCVGSLPSNPNARNIEKYSNNYGYFSSYNYQLETPESDTKYKESNIENYTVDWEQLETLGIKTIKDTTNGNYYWLASRDFRSDSGSTNFGVRSVNVYGALSYDYLCYKENTSRVPSKSLEYGLRPCITLKSNIKTTEMNGKKYLSLE